MTTTRGTGPGMFLYEVDGRGGRDRRGHGVRGGRGRAGGRRRRQPHHAVAARRQCRHWHRRHRHRQAGHHAHRHRRLRLLLCKQNDTSNTITTSYNNYYVLNTVFPGLRTAAAVWPVSTCQTRVNRSSAAAIRGGKVPGEHNILGVRNDRERSMDKKETTAQTTSYVSFKEPLVYDNRP